MKLFIKTLLLVIAISGIGYFIPQIHIQSMWTALGLIILLTILNIFVKPLLIFLTIPITILTFGVFLLFINTILILIADWLMSGFHVDSVGWAFLFSILLSLVHYLINNLMDSKETKS
jgi:putative membrane protein